MVTYQIKITEGHQEAFLGILKSLEQLGVVASFKTLRNLSQPGGPLAVEELLDILNTSEQQAKQGALVPAEQVIAFMRSWKLQQNA